MRIVILLITLSILLCIVGCASSIPDDLQAVTKTPIITDAQVERPSSAIGTDLTVSVNGFDIDGKNIVGESASQASFIKIYPNAEALCEDSEIIVVGSVMDVAYDDGQDMAMTYYNFKIDESWDGELKPGDTITVEKIGGYIRGNVFSKKNQKPELNTLTENDIIMETRFGLPFPEKDDCYILFLKEGANGVYNLLGDFMGQYFINDGKVSRYLPDSEANLYAEFTYTPDPETLDGLRAVVEKTLCAIKETSAAIPSFDDIRENYWALWSTMAENDDTIDLENETKMLEYYDALVKFVKETAQKTETRPTALFLGVNTPLQVAGGDTFQSLLIETAGGANAAKTVVGKGDFTKTDIEQIQAMNPQYIYILENAKFSVNDIMDDERWEEIDAVKNGNVISFPARFGSWDSPLQFNRNENVNVCLGAAFMLHHFHPELYPIETMQKDVTGFYAFYGESWTPEELGIG